MQTTLKTKALLISKENTMEDHKLVCWIRLKRLQRKYTNKEIKSGKVWNNRKEPVFLQLTHVFIQMIM
jgi:hypothetical protein